MFLVSELLIAPILLEEELGGSLGSGISNFSISLQSPQLIPTDRLGRTNYRAQIQRIRPPTSIQALYATAKTGTMTEHVNQEASLSHVWLARINASVHMPVWRLVCCKGSAFRTPLGNGDWESRGQVWQDVIYSSMLPS